MEENNEEKIIEDVQNKILEDTMKVQQTLDNMFNEFQNVTNNPTIFESMARSLRDAEEFSKHSKGLTKLEEPETKINQSKKYNEPEITKLIEDFIKCELNIVSNYEFTDSEKQLLQDYDKNILAEYNQINNKRGLAGVLSKSKNEKHKKKATQLIAEKEEKRQEIELAHAKKYAAYNEQRCAILDQISNHSRGLDGLGVLDEMFEGYSKQLVDVKNDLLEQMRIHNNKAKASFPHSVFAIQSMLEGKTDVSNLKEEKSKLEAESKILIVQADEINKAKNLIFEKINNRLEEKIETERPDNSENEKVIGSNTKKIVQQTFDELLNTQSIIAYKDFKESLKRSKMNTKPTKQQDEEIGDEFNRF